MAASTPRTKPHPVPLRRRQQAALARVIRALERDLPTLRFLDGDITVMCAALSDGLTAARQVKTRLPAK